MQFGSKGSQRTGPGRWEKYLGWRGVRPTQRCRASGREGAEEGVLGPALPAQHLPVPSIAQLVPVGSPRHGPGSSTPTVLEADLRTQGAQHSQEGWGRRASPVLPWLSQGQQCSHCHPMALLPPHPGQTGTPTSPMHRVPHPVAAAAVAPSSCSPLSSHVGRAPPAQPRLRLRRTEPRHSPSPAPRTGSPPWRAAAQSTAPCARGRAAGPPSPSARGCGSPPPAAGPAGGQGGSTWAWGAPPGWGRPRAAVPSGAGGLLGAVPARRSGPSASRCSPHPPGAPAGRTPGKRPERTPLSAVGRLAGLRAGRGGHTAVSVPVVTSPERARASPVSSPPRTWRSRP